ncbi:hypothetical protein V1512DRAFT_259588, partial [Lipomyces arxii]|uniref:uncharacterized protein n=1 Tax=Lipomyces arxii TaxID=56418 RepID=UPI0034CD3318
MDNDVDDSTLYKRKPDEVHGPMSFAETEKRPFVICAGKIEDSTRSAYDFTLVATDGKNPFSCRVTSSREYRGPKNIMSDEDWGSLILWAFLHINTFTDPNTVDKYLYPQSFMKGAKKHGNYEVTLEHYFDDFITILGTFEFEYNDDVSINLSRWQTDGIRDYLLQSRKMVAVEKELRNSRAQIDALNDQIREFIDKKDTSEKLILEKVRLLLNEKKKKIQELGGDRDLDQDFEIEENEPEQRVVTPTRRKRKAPALRTPPTRTRKRKVSTSASEIDEDSVTVRQHRSATMDAYHKSPLSKGRGRGNGVASQKYMSSPTPGSSPHRIRKRQSVAAEVDVEAEVEAEAEAESEVPTESDDGAITTSADEA